MTETMTLTYGSGTAHRSYHFGIEIIETYTAKSFKPMARMTIDGGIPFPISRAFAAKLLREIRAA